jgi:hypothetical protein
MSDIALKDILINARQESYRMRHFYLGTEHLLIALLDIKGSLISSIIQEYGLTPEYVIDAIRRKIGKGSKHRLWAGVPQSPRAEVVLSIANDLALENGRDEINERDLLIALLEENDSIPIRVLSALGLTDMGKLAEMARTYTLNNDSQRPYVRIEFGPEFQPEDVLNREQMLVLRRVFYGYNQIRVERRLTGGFSNALLLVVTPLLLDQREDAAVVVKINQVDAILDEAQRYESHVKYKLPPMTARLEDKPVAPDTSDLAGLKYTLVAGSDRIPKDLRAFLTEWSPETLGEWLKKELFPVFGRIWWQQSRPYRFQIWREYDWMLPPILTLERINGKKAPPETQTIRMPVRGSRIRELEYGDPVQVENFIVQKVYPERNAIQLAAGQGNEAARAYKIEVRGIDLTSDTYYRGEVVENIMGRVWQTRSEQLLQAARTLEPDFDVEAEKIPVNLPQFDRLPNPIYAYESLLDSYVNGSLSTIHGDLHPGNIMIGPNQSAFLIDFAGTREGHAVFDWANLESSLLADVVMPQYGETWEEARQVLTKIYTFNGTHPMVAHAAPSTDPDMGAVRAVREIAQSCLLAPEKWSEYLIALAFCGLRAITWDTMPPAGRRLLFLVSALSIHELRTRFRPFSETETPSPDETEINNYSF